MSSDRIALVSGANKGLGFETSRQLARRGISVIMGSRNLARGRKSAKALREEGLAVEPIKLDVAKSDDIKKIVAFITERYGKLDILVNNAGMAHREEPLFASSVLTVSPAALRKTFAVNFFGLVELTQALLPLLRNSSGGRIVNVSSILGSLTIQSGGGEMSAIKPFAYDASKTAVNAFTVHLSAALKDTFMKVNSVHPGWVRTDMGGPQAPLSPAEGAHTAVRLATIGPEGPTGKFFHHDEELPW